jgi:cellobiose-specific phosphotransferase system component IIB
MSKIKPMHIITAVIATAVVLALRYVVFPAKFLPGEFTEARIKGSDIAQNIVQLSRTNLALLNEVAKYDQDNNHSKALIAISNALVQNRLNQVEAIRLSEQLTVMAEQSQRIQPARGREVATEAVASEVALVSRLVYYNDYLNRLFETLKVKFEKPWVSYLDGQVNDLVNKVNDEAQAINELNKKFVASMAELDAIVGK